MDNYKRNTEWYCKKCGSLKRPNPYRGYFDLTCPECYPQVFKNG